MSQLDDQLEEMRRAHRATARYTVYLKPANFAKGREVIEMGLTWDEATARRDALNLTLAPRGFGDKLYGMELEPVRQQEAQDVTGSSAKGKM